MKKTLFFVMVLFVFSLLGNATQTYGLEMSAEQKELWNRVQTNWEIMKKGDMEAFEANLSKEFAFLGYGNTFPHTRNSYLTVVRDYLAGKIASYKLEPYAITISGSVGTAIFAWELKNLSGRVISARSAQTYIKQNGKWLFLGGTSCSCTAPPPCEPLR